VKAVGCKSIVFTALIDHADVSVSCSIFIRDHAVKLPYLQRSRVPVIIEAYSKYQCLICVVVHHDSSKNGSLSLSLNSIFPMPWASYQWISATREIPSTRRTLATPLSLRHLPGPYRLVSRTRSRKPLPLAIVSTWVISPITSKSVFRIDPHSYQRFYPLTLRSATAFGDLEAARATDPFYPDIRVYDIPHRRLSHSDRIFLCRRPKIS
jgi:hypothetical protein